MRRSGEVKKGVEWAWRKETTRWGGRGTRPTASGWGTANPPSPLASPPSSPPSTAARPASAASARFRLHLLSFPLLVSLSVLLFSFLSSLSFFRPFPLRVLPDSASFWSWGYRAIGRLFVYVYIFLILDFDFFGYAWMNEGHDLSWMHTNECDHSYRCRSGRIPFCLLLPLLNSRRGIESLLYLF